jgi:HEXXH motif-containing protein
MKLLHFTVDPDQIAQHLVQLANLNRIETYNSAPELFEFLEFEDDQTFLEPALFFFNATKDTQLQTTPLEQILWGYMHTKDRPRQITVRTCTEGCVALPQVGNFQTTLPATNLNLTWNGGQQFRLFQEDGKEVPATFFPEEFLPGSPIRIARHVLDSYPEYHKVKMARPVAQVVDQWQGTLAKAYQLMQKATPEICQLLEQSTREISLFSSANFNSHAAIAYFGTAFLNVEDEPYDEAFFLDDLAHQCGHVIFNALTLHAEEYLTVPKTTPLGTLIGYESERRPVYGAFHGLFTYTTILHTLDRCISAQLLNQRQLQEAIGRIGFYQEKFRYDLINFQKAGVFTKQGNEFYQGFLASHKMILDKYRHLPKASFEGQPYTFRYELFLKNNPAYRELDYHHLNSTEQAIG